MDKRAVNKKTRANIPKPIMITLIIMAVLALLSIVSGAFKSGGNGPGGNVDTPGVENQLPENLPPNLILDVDTDVKLHQNSHGAVYTKNTTNEYVDNAAVIYATNQANGDYVEIDFSDVSFKEFWDSNHTQLKLSFDVIGFKDIAFPTMKITPVFSEDAPNFYESFTKISPLSSSRFSTTTACTTEGGVLGSFDVPGIHTFEYVFTKNGNELALKVSIDEISETFIYYFSDYDFEIEGIKIDISNQFTETTAVRIANVNVGYVPSLAAFPGESIVVPSDALVTFLGSKPLPIYNAYLHEDKLTLTGGTTITVDTSVPSGAYASIYLKDDYKSISVFDYDYLTIDFDVSVPDGKIPMLRCMAYLLGRPGGVKQYVESNVWYVRDEGSLYAVNSEKTHMCEVASTIHVEYVIKLDHTAQTGHLQVYLNGVLYYDAPGAFDATYNCIEELRVKHFDTPGSISFANLVVNGYNVTN